MSHRYCGIKLLPDSATGYCVFLDGAQIGSVYGNPPFRSWFFRNDDRGWYGEVHTRAQAIVSLMELSEEHNDRTRDRKYSRRP